MPFLRLSGISRKKVNEAVAINNNGTTIGRNDLKSDPARIATAVTATGDIRKKITNAMKKLMGEFDDVSDN
jgi:hypothetical protein